MKQHGTGFVIVLVVAGLMTVLAQGVKLPEEIAGYLQWHRANAQKSFEESAHPVAKDIYLNEEAVATVMSMSFPYAEGSVIVKERLDPSTLTVTTLYTMRKVAGFDPDSGNWQYGEFKRQEDGSFGGGWMTPEAAAMCIGCHSSAADTDYTFLTYLLQVQDQQEQDQ